MHRFHPAQLLSLLLEVSAVRTRNDVDVTTATDNLSTTLRAARKREMQQLWF
jgi:hypothetical protein